MQATEEVVAWATKGVVVRATTVERGCGKGGDAWRWRRGWGDRTGASAGAGADGGGCGCGGGGGGVSWNLDFFFN
ncbi:UNVERIFIED_CONTAM: hypothetical protein Sangu_2537400 [Sesamum angustifolium]|uniref:Uncharacterized protein n=1 Tax=Sesamum angustifolium TaxID=2727405 RepID=A0AAW2J9A6_9LAMI